MLPATSSSLASPPKTKLNVRAAHQATICLLPAATHCSLFYSQPFSNHTTLSVTPPKPISADKAGALYLLFHVVMHHAFNGNTKNQGLSHISQRIAEWIPRNGSSNTLKYGRGASKSPPKAGCAYIIFCTMNRISDVGAPPFPKLSEGRSRESRKVGREPFTRRNTAFRRVCTASNVDICRLMKAEAKLWRRSDCGSVALKRLSTWSCRSRTGSAARS